MAEQKNNNRRNRQSQLPIDPHFGHIQPQAPEMEKAVLGALMIDREAYLLVCEILRPESFYEPRHQIIYDAIRQLSINEKPVDVLTVTEQLERMGDLENVGGPVYVAELSSMVATSANIEFHANIIAEKFLSRQLISYTSTIGTKAFDATNDVHDVIQDHHHVVCSFFSSGFSPFCKDMFFGVSL